MKYMTKELCRFLEDTSLHKMLPPGMLVTELAAHFSQEFYEGLYQEKEDEAVRWGEEVYNLQPDHPPIGPDEIRAFFKKMQRENVRSWKKRLPEHILRQVADIRVLALGCISPDVKREITAWCKQNEKTATQTAKEYLKLYKAMRKKGDPPFLEDFGFHDSRIASCRKRGEDLVIMLDNSGGWPEFKGVIFEQCTVLKKDRPFLNAWWETEEIYPIEGGYEIHVLLQESRCTKYIDFIVQVTGVRLIR